MLSLQHAGVPSYKKPSLIAQGWIISLSTPSTDHSPPSHASLWHSSRPLSPSVPCSASQPGYVLLKGRLGLVPSLVRQHPTYCRCSLDVCWMNDCEFLQDFWCSGDFGCSSESKKGSSQPMTENRWWGNHRWAVQISVYVCVCWQSREGDGTLLQYSCLENRMDGGAWWAAVHKVAKSRTWLSDFTFTFHFHALEKEMATHSSVLAWRISGTGQPGGLPSMGSHRVGHDWSDLAAAAAVLTIADICYLP